MAAGLQDACSRQSGVGLSAHVLRLNLATCHVQFKICECVCMFKHDMPMPDLICVKPVYIYNIYIYDILLKALFLHHNIVR